MRFAVLRGRSEAIPTRSTLLAVTAAVTAVFATIAFANSLVALVDTPSRYGQGWDRMVDAQFGPAPVRRVIDRFATSSKVQGIGVGNYGDISVNGLPVPAFDLQAVHGDISVSILEGRPSTAADEIVLGSETMDRLGVRVGDLVDVDIGNGARPMLLTGRGVFPRMGQGSFSTTGLGIGAQLAGGTLASFGDFETVPPDYELDGRRYNFVAIDLVGSPSALDGELAELEASAIADEAFVFVRHEQPPGKIRDLDRVRVVPTAMAGVLALVALAALSHLLLTSVRERRRELALLGTLGFSRRQLRASVSWHASTVARGRAGCRCAPRHRARAERVAVVRPQPQCLSTARDAVAVGHRHGCRDGHPRQSRRRNTRTFGSQDTARHGPARRVTAGRQVRTPDLSGAVSDLVEQDDRQRASDERRTERIA